MEDWSFRSSSESSEGNAEFTKILRAWLRKHDVSTEAALGVVMLVLLPDGFDVLQLGPDPVSDEQLAAYVRSVGRSMTAHLEHRN